MSLHNRTISTILLLLFSNILLAQLTLTTSGISKRHETSLSWADFENDGDLDLVIEGDSITQSNSKLLFCTNNAGIFSLSQEFTTSTSYRDNFQWYDIDNDNDLDLIQGSSPIIIYKNTNGIFTRSQANIGANSGAFQVADFNNDGIPELLIKNTLYFQKNNIYFPYTQVPGFESFLNNVSSIVADFNNDGYRDFILTGDTASNIAPVTYLYSGNGDLSFNEIPLSNVTGVRSGDIDVADFDNDGQTDLIMLGTTLTIYKNNGNFSFTDLVLGMTGGSFGDIACGDYDNDGLCDFAYMVYTGTGSLTSVIKNNNGTLFTNSGITLSNISSGQCKWGDYDNDGDLDLLISGGNTGNETTDLYTNTTILPNNLPGSPVNITTNIQPGNTLSADWNDASDIETPASGLSYQVRLKNLSMNKNIIPGTSDEITGYHLIAEFGMQKPSAVIVKKLNFGTHQIDVQTIDNQFAGSSFTSSTFQVNTPINPDLLFPLNGATNRPTNLILQWDSAFGATRYHAQVASDSLFQNIISQDSNLIVRTYNPIGINQFSPYFWRVRAANGLNWGAWSDIWKFTTIPGNSINNINQSFTPAAWASRFHWVDFDGDSDIDFVTEGDSTTSPTTNCIKFYSNESGQGDFSPFTPQVQSGLLYDAVLSWNDINSDGFPDFALSGNRYINTVVPSFLGVCIYNNGGYTFDTLNFPRFYAQILEWNDFDHDNDPDLLVSGYDPLTPSVREVILYENKSGLFYPYPINLSGVPYETVQWIDYNSDGYSDIFLSGRTSPTVIAKDTKVYRNLNGNGFQLVSTGLENYFFFGNKNSVWLDIDQDGDMDIAGICDTVNNSYVSANYRFYIIRNLSGQFTLHQQLSPILETTTMAAGDINNDGKTDLVVSGFSNVSVKETRIWYNNGLTFNNNTQNLIGVAGGAVSLGDINNDNVLDIGITGFNTAGNPTTLVFRNDNLQGNISPLPPAWTNSTTMGSDVQLSWSYGTDNSTGQGALLYNTWIGKQQTAPGLTSTNSIQMTGNRTVYSQPICQQETHYEVKNLNHGWYYWQVQSIDVSLNGSIFTPLDSFFIGTPDNPLLLSPADNASGVPTQTLFTWQSADAAQTYTVDIALDSSFNQLVHSASLLTDTFFNYQLQIFQTYYWRVRAQNQAGLSPWSDYRKFNTFASFTAIPNITIDGFGVSVADYDNDNDIDLLVTGTCIQCSDSSFLLRNDSTGVFTKIIGAGIPHQMQLEINQWGDYDNDGDLDLLIAGATIGTSPYNPVTKVLNNNNGIFTDINAPLTGIFQGDAEWVDFDQDGDLDIAITGRIGTVNHETKIYRNDSGIFSLLFSNIPGYGFGNMAWGDYDNDGDPDLAICGTFYNPSPNSVLKIYRNDRDSLIDIGVTLANIAFGILDWIDIDRDGYLDLSLFGKEPSNLKVCTVFKNNNTSFQAVPITPIPQNSNLEWLYIKWANIDGDGDDDLMMSYSIGSSLNSPGYTDVYINNGNLSFIRHQEVLPAGYNLRQLFDADGDGDLDMASRSTTTGISQLFLNNQIIQPFSANNHPSPPAIQNVTVNNNTIIVSFAPGSDAETITGDLTYQFAVHKVQDTLFTMFPYSDTITGFRKMYLPGKLKNGTSFNLTSIDSGTYLIRAQTLDVSNSGSLFTPPQFVNVLPPLAPSLLSPADSSITPCQNTFTWVGLNNTIKYNIQVATDPAFLQLVIDDSTVTGTSFTSTSLNCNSWYYWRVRAMRNNAWTPFSTEWSLHTSDLIVSPVNSTSACPYSPTVMSFAVQSFGNMLSGNTYTIELSDANGSFLTPLVIGSHNSVNTTDTILCTIPAGLTAASGYKVRGTSSLPAYTSNDSINSITIYAPLINTSLVASSDTACIGTIDTLSVVGNGYTLVNWSPVSSNASQAYAYYTGTYFASLTDTNGCQTTDSIHIVLENCNLVWPGDANNDLVVDVSDILPIGVHFGENGFTRSYVTNNWQGCNALDWGYTQANGFDIKHADCNGDGIVNFSDTVAVNLNNGNIHPLGMPVNIQNQSSPIPVKLSSFANAYPPGGQVTLFYEVGDQNTIAANLYGVAAFISMPGTVIQPGSNYQIYSLSWLGNLNQDMFARVITANNMNDLEIAICRNDHFSRTGTGAVAASVFTLSNNLQHGDSILFNLNRAILIDSLGFQYNDTIISNSIVIHIDTNASSAALHGDFKINGTRIYPNPFKESPTLLFQNNSFEAGTIEILNLTGHRLTEPKWIQIHPGLNEAVLDQINELSSGIYFVRLSTKNQLAMIKLVKL